MRTRAAGCATVLLRRRSCRSLPSIVGRNRGCEPHGPAIASRCASGGPCRIASEEGWTSCVRVSIMDWTETSDRLRIFRVTSVSPQGDADVTLIRPYLRALSYWSAVCVQHPVGRAPFRREGGASHASGKGPEGGSRAAGSEPFRPPSHAAFCRNDLASQVHRLPHALDRDLTPSGPARPAIRAARYTSSAPPDWHRRDRVEAPWFDRWRPRRQKRSSRECPARLPRPS